MPIDFNLSSLSDTRPHEYAQRFLFGGLCTALAGLVAKEFGPGVGGLFLAFPAIFPATVSLIQTHEMRRKARDGGSGRERGKKAAAIDSFAAALGTLGLMAFAITLWQTVARIASALALLISISVWAGVSLAAYWIHRRIHAGFVERLRHSRRKGV